MTSPFQPCLRHSLALLLVCAALAGCGGEDSKPKEYVYVVAEQVSLRDRVAQVYNKVGMVKNGERLEVLDRQKRFLKVRTAAGLEGWMEQRYVVGQAVFDAMQKLASENAAAPAQAQGVTRADLNMHVTPGRDTEKLYRLQEAERISLLRRAAAEKPGVFQAPKSGEDKPQPVLEDWWLVRDARGRAGWVLGRMLDVDLPLDVAQYAEGQRIVAAFVLSEAEDDGRKVPQYLVAYTEPKDGLPFDYNQVRVFTWNAKRDRYETAYRERKLNGAFPITVGREAFGKEGTLPSFTLRLKDGSGAAEERKYKMNGVMVRRVLPPGEPPQQAARKGR